MYGTENKRLHGFIYTPEFLPKENVAEVKAMLNSLKFTSADADDNGVAIKLTFNTPAKAAAKKPAAPLSAAEQALAKVQGEKEMLDLIESDVAEATKPH